MINKDYMLGTPLARQLYHEIAAHLPIIDYHCHLSPQDLAENRSFENLTQLWLKTDPYKHRLMRMLGIPENDITGTASDEQKFTRWAQTVPSSLGTPLFAWSAMELKRYFGVNEMLSPQNADIIYTKAEKLLQTEDFSSRKLLQLTNVQCVCTSDRLLDDLSHHKALANSDYSVKVLSSLRGDDLLSLSTEWLQQLTADYRHFDAFTAAVSQKLNDFDSLGCKLADHGLDRFEYQAVGHDTLSKLYEKHTAGHALSETESRQLRSGILHWLGQEYAQRGWVLQLHLGAQRATSTRLRQLTNGAGGYAAIGNSIDISSLTAYLDDLEKKESLPRVIIYNLNPVDNAPLATLTGSFTEDGVPGKIQLGPAWWFNDHHAGITSHLDTLSSYGLLSAFIGMTTDSRSLLSMTRHEYFRRLLCSWIAEQVKAGSFPNDAQLLENIIRKAAYGNAAQYLNLENKVAS
ncbi:glucuronate isomerase [Cerasicoccus fimbriatus]|uniref:glucuronate isomerase n=1 Tax=Cerasicoccus fimbriatus TaxID=3014554 RepID=UPI0022B4CD8A|nr:glucuronate isomerase [Cerasicoccus sp. TK19100]